MKITVIATGFDEARSRLASMVSRSRPIGQTGFSTGIVSEKPATRPGFSAPVGMTPQQDEVTVSPTPAPEPETQSETEDDWDIPAFLRQGK